MSNRTGIVIPCYNEENRLPVEQFEDFLNHQPRVTYCFVDDGSSDNTLSILKGIQSNYSSQVVVLDNEQNIGKAESVRKGMKELLHQPQTIEVIGFLDADLATSVKELYMLSVYLQANSLNAVFGSRIKRLGATIDRSGKRHYMGRVIASIIGYITVLPIYDSQCGAKVFTAKTLEPIINEVFQTKWLFDVELILRMKAQMGNSVMLEKVCEYPLQKWTEVGDSKITLTELVKIPFELYKLFRISLRK
jgi:glycosyltransferase involved in cell wall biosynthesis